MLERAVDDGNFELIKLLIDYGADVRCVDFEAVCGTGHPLIIKFFLDRGVNADQPLARALPLGSNGSFDCRTGLAR